MYSAKSTSMRGFAVLGIVVALAMLSALTFSLVYLVASKESGMRASHYMNQGFYVSHAAFEYSMRNMRALHNCSPSTRQIVGTDLGLSFPGKIYSSTSFGANGTFAGNSLSITAPGSNPGPCIYVLSSTGSSAMQLSGGATLNSTCVINVNSSSSSALSLSNNSTLTVSTINIVGNYSANKASITGTVNTGVTAATDPFINIPMVSYGNTCDYNSYSVTGTATLNPGVYCGGLSISGNGTVTFNPGNYIIDGGTVSMTGSGTVTATGVTIFLNKQIQSSYPTITIGGNVNFTLTAPTSGTYKGIAIYQSRNAPNGSNKITGSSGANVTGAIYLPNQDLDFTGSMSSSAPCTLPVSNTLTISGSTKLNCVANDLSGLVSTSC